VFERQHGRSGSVIEVDERCDAAAIADDGELPLVEGFEHPVVGCAVEAAVAQRDSAGCGHGLVERTAWGSSKSRAIGFAPSARMRSAPAAERDVPMTWCPR